MFQASVSHTLPKTSDDFFLRSILSALILVFSRECWDESKFLFLTLGLYKVLPTVDSRCLQPSREIEKVRVIGNSKQITGSKEIGKWMGRKGNYAKKYTGMDTEFELE